MANLISSAARTRLQILYGQFAARSFDVTKSREDRMTWATKCLGKPVVSFSDLTGAEGKILIDNLQAILGVAQTAPPRRQRLSKREGQKHGTEGRRDQLHAETTMLDGTENVFALIKAEMSKLGWDESRLRAFLRSRQGPNNGRDTIRTLADANRAHWALKNLVRYQEKTQKRGAVA